MKSIDTTIDGAAGCSSPLAAGSFDVERWHHLLFQGHPDPMLLLDRESRIVLANPAVHARFGHDLPGLVGQPLSQLIPDWDRPDMLAELAQGAQPHDAALRHAQGRRCDVEITLIEVAEAASGDTAYIVVARDVTAQRRRRRQMQVQAEILARTRDAMVVLDEQGEIVCWNAGATALYGEAADAMAGRRFDQLFDKPQRARLERALDDARLPASKPVEVRLLRRDAQGAEAVLHLSLSTLAGVEPGRELVVVQGQNLSLACPVHHADRCAPVGEGAALEPGGGVCLIHSLLEGSADAIVVTDEDGCAHHVNSAARQLFGPNAAPGLPLPLAGPWRPGTDEERRLVDGRGQERWLQLRVTGAAWKGRAALLVTLRDLTERRAAEQGLLLSRRAMESSANGIAICDALDARQPLIYVNRAFERITGYSAGEVLGRNCRFLQGQERDQPGVGRLREAMARGRDVQVELRNFRKDGGLFWNELSVSPVRNVEGVVTHFVGILNDTTMRREQDAELLRRMSQDRLTGLPNRDVLLDRLRQALTSECPDGRHVALLYVDLDQFKEINDTLGYEAGDQVLQEVVGRLRKGLRPGDILARLGGDEFLMLLTGLAHPQEAGVVATRLLEAVAKPYELGGTTVFCSCSVGVAHADSAVDDPMHLIRRADLAVHAAKRAGRNNVQIESGDLAQRVSERLELRTLLHGAGARNELALHFQPQMDLVSQRICGIEALLRWKHPLLGDVSPARFIPVAEETGQIVALGEWVLDEACRQHRQWLDSGLLDCPVAVNVSGVQFQRATFVDVVEAALSRHGLPGSRLELELTESVTMDSGSSTLAKLARLRELGVRLAIDDFGTGFSSLAYLKRLPIDKVKIDRTFINDLTHDSDDAAITLSVIAIAHHLRLRVVAEGVETMGQLSYLKRHLCDEVQGYLVSRPLAAAAFEAFLAGFTPPGAEGREGDLAVGGGPTLLLVDDEPNILRALTRTLRRDGYRILTAGGAAEAFDVLACNDVHVIVSDQRMPHVCGTDFLSQVKCLYPHTVRLVLSGYTDLVSVTEAINRGAIYRFLTKPWNDEQLRSHVREAFVHQQGRRSAAPGG